MTPQTKIQVSRIDYCQYLLSSQISYTLTYFADHSEKYSHDAMNRLLSQDRMTPRLVWENVRNDVKQVAGGYLLFDQELRHLGDLWWSLTRNPPHTANTPLGDAAVMAWLVAGYDPEGRGNPPDDTEKLLDWMAEAANNVTAVVDVFTLAQQAIGSEHDITLVDSVRASVSAWREMNSASLQRTTTMPIRASMLPAPLDERVVQPPNVICRPLDV